MKTVIRVGDRVRILRPRWIKRIGYALHFRDLVDEVERDPRTAAAWQALTGQTTEATAISMARLDMSGMPSYFLEAVAKLRVEQRGFGGSQRQIIYCKPADQGQADALTISCSDGQGYMRAGGVCEVHGKRIAKTGIRVPARGGQHSDGEYWEEPGGLDDMKTHVILSVGGGELEACDVELVARGK